MRAILFIALVLVPVTGNAQEELPTKAAFQSVFEEVVDNCKTKGIKMSKADVVVRRERGGVSVMIPTLPKLTGKKARGGKLRVDATKTSEGVRAAYGFSGRVTGPKLQGVFIVEYFKANKPQCTQSWSVVGKRK